MTRRKRLHGKKRRSPARFFGAIANKMGALRSLTPANEAKPIGEDQTNYDPDIQQEEFQVKLKQARLEASMAMDRQKEKYEGLSSGGGSGAHTHASKGSGNVFKQQSDLYKSPELRLTGSQAEGTGVQGGFQQKMQSMLGKQMQFQTVSPFAKKGGFKMKRKK